MEPRVLALESQVRQLGPRVSTPEPYQLPYWSIVRLADGEAITSSSFPEFDDETRTDRVFSSYATARGELFLHQWDDHCPARARIIFEADIAFTVNVRVLADGAGDWHIDVNGTLASYTASQDLTLSFKDGQNVVTIYKDDADTDRLLFEGVLFDGKTCRWIPE